LFATAGGDPFLPPQADNRTLDGEAMELKNQADHIAMLSLMMAGVLTKRLIEIGQLDTATATHLHKLVLGVRTHAKEVGLTDLNNLFDSVDKKLSEQLAQSA
jgi:hypothetical protein